MRRTVALIVAALTTATLATFAPTPWQPGRVPPPGYHTLGTKWTSAPAVLR